jgi:hypothetical protein
VLDWAEGRAEALSRLSVEQRIQEVNRQFGVSMRIRVIGRLRPKMDLEKLSKTMQEKISFESMIKTKRGVVLEEFGS